jgi:hypothetical protein
VGDFVDDAWVCVYFLGDCDVLEEACQEGQEGADEALRGDEAVVWRRVEGEACKDFWRWWFGGEGERGGYGYGKRERDASEVVDEEAGK